MLHLQQAVSPTDNTDTESHRILGTVTDRVQYNIKQNATLVGTGNTNVLPNCRNS